MTERTAGMALWRTIERTLAAEIAAFRPRFIVSQTRSLAGWNAHRLARVPGGGWRILVKQINLLEGDQNLRNPSLLL